MATQALARGGVQKRHILVLMCAIATFICYIDRVNISVAIIPMADANGWSGTEKGLVLSSFFIGYMAAMVPAGWLANRIGGKLLLGLALIGWSAFTFLTPLAAGISFATLIVTRILMGAGEAASFPAIYNLLARWMPSAEKSRAAAINLTGIPLGTIFALLTTGWLIEHHGWESVFYAFGGLGLVFAAFWFRMIHARPSLHPTIGAGEASLLAPVEAASGTVRQPIPWRALLAHRAVWALIVNHFCNNWTLYLMLAWLPSYFRDVQGLSVAGSGLFAIGPWVCQFVIGNAAAVVADRMIARGASVTSVRKWAQCGGLLGGATFFLLALYATTPLMALICMCGALGVGALAFAGFAVNHLDIAPRHADVLWGITNTAGTLPGIVGVTATGLLLDLTGGYAATFVLAAAVNIVGAALWLAWGTGERIID